MILHIPSGGEVAFQPQEVGTIETIARTQKIQPFANLGIRPIQANRFFLGLEMGLLYQGSPQVNIMANGIIDDSYVDQRMVDKIVSPYKWYPLVRLETGIRF